MNKVVLIGNLTKDPELTKTPTDVSVCRFSIAVSRGYTSPDRERKTDFFNCTAWRGLGENVAKYARKGNKLAVTGSIEIRNYEDSAGNKRTAVDIIAQDVEFLTPKSDEVGGDVPMGDGRRGYTKLQAFDDDSDILF